ncbi:MAG: SIMPL domain-containing protein [Planctomycetota bacterium]
MDNKIWKIILATVVILTVGAVGGVVSTAVLASRAYQSKFEYNDKREQTLQVTGSARRRIHSDLAVWRIRISSDAKELSEAYKALKEGDDKVTAFLTKHAFKPTEIAAQAVQTETIFKVEWRGKDNASRHETHDVESYNLSRYYTITSPRVDAVAGPAAAVTELIEQGVKIVSDAPNFYFSKIADLKVEMIGEASRDARARADQLVTNAGCTIAQVRHARMGVLQITQPNSTDVSDSGIYDTSTIEKDVTSVVSLTLGIR